MLGLHQSREPRGIREGVQAVEHVRQLVAMLLEQSTGAVELGLAAVTEEDRDVLAGQQQLLVPAVGRVDDRRSPASSCSASQA